MGLNLATYEYALYCFQRGSLPEAYAWAFKARAEARRCEDLRGIAKASVLIDIARRQMKSNTILEGN